MRRWARRPRSLGPRALRSFGDMKRPRTKPRNSDLWDPVPVRGSQREREAQGRRKHRCWRKASEVSSWRSCHLGEESKDKGNVLGRGNSSRKNITGTRGGCGRTEGISRKCSSAGLQHTEGIGGQREKISWERVMEGAEKLLRVWTGGNLLRAALSASSFRKRLAKKA